MAAPVFNPGANPYGLSTAPDQFEQQAGVNAPGYFSYLGANGQLQAPYAVDPSQSEAFKQMQGISESSGLSPWASLQQQLNDQNTQKQIQDSQAQNMGATGAALTQLQTIGGGTGSGAAQQLAEQGSRNTTMAQQNIASQGNANNLSIQQQDALNKQNMLGQVANAETGAQASNAASAMQDTNLANAYNLNRYNQQMSAWGAAQTAGAQRAAAGNTGKK